MTKNISEWLGSTVRYFLLMVMTLIASSEYNRRLLHKLRVEHHKLKITFPGSFGFSEPKNLLQWRASRLSYRDVNSMKILISSAVGRFDNELSYGNRSYSSSSWNSSFSVLCCFLKFILLQFMLHFATVLKHSLGLHSAPFPLKKQITR